MKNKSSESSWVQDVTTEGLVDWHGCLPLVSEAIQRMREKDCDRRTKAEVIVKL